MPEYTPNLNLPKPLGNENVSRSNHNALVEAIDTNAAPKVHTHNASDIDAGTMDSARLPDASISVKGVVQLEDSISSASTTKAATPSAVKAVKDALVAHEAESAADPTPPHGMGTAAAKNVQTSATDGTAERLMAVGAFGVGEVGIGGSPGPITISDANVLTRTGFYNAGATWTGSPYAGTSGNNQGYLQHYNWNPNYALEVFTNVNSTIKQRFRIKDNNVWSAWRDLIDSTGGTISGQIAVTQVGGSTQIKLERTGANAGTVYVGVADFVLTIYNSELTQSMQIDPTNYIIYFGSVLIRAGSGSPEGVVSANVGSIFMRTNGAADTTLYKKTSGAGNTGWTAS